MSLPLADVVPGPRGQLLSTLIQLEAPVTVRALARHAGVAPQTALSTVNDLAEAGLVITQRAGQAQLVALNKAHILVRPLVALGRTRARLIEMLRGELARWPDLAGAWLYGDAAQGAGDRQSAVALLLVAHTSTDSAEWGEATARLVNRVLRWTGNQVQLAEHSRGSFALLIRDRHQLIALIRAEGIALTKDSDRLLRTRP